MDARDGWRPSVNVSGQGLDDASCRNRVAVLELGVEKGETTEPDRFLFDDISCCAYRKSIAAFSSIN